MSAARRLSRLEGALPPKTAVLLWLGEMHRFGSLERYVAWLFEQPSGASPFLEVPERARAAARAAHAGEPRPLLREAERRAASEALFLLGLAVELEMVAIRGIRVGILRLESLRWESRARKAEGAADRRGWAAWRTGVLDLVTELARAELARRSLEERYLDGRETLSPVTLAAWRELREGVATLVATITTLPGGRRGRRPDGAAIDAAAERTAPDEARRLIERVRARALDLLGDHAGAMAIVERGLRRGTT